LKVGDVRTHEFTYHGVPYIRYSDKFNNNDNGVRMTVKTHSPSEGKLNIVYSGPSSVYGWANVDVYIQMRNKPDNVLKIQSLKNDIIELKTEITETEKLLNKSNDNIDKFNVALLDVLKKGLESSEKLKESRLQTLNLEREKLETDISQEKDTLAKKSKNLKELQKK